MFRGKVDRVRDDLGEFPHYLYEVVSFFPQYLLNSSTFVDVINILKSGRFRTTASGHLPDDWDTFDKYYTFSRSNALREYFSFARTRANDAPEPDTSLNLGQMERSFSANMLSLIERFPNVQFDILFPPYSILLAKAKLAMSPEAFQMLLAFNTRISGILIAQPNVTLFNFADDAAITHNLDLYKDMAHYSSSVNRYIIDSIASNTHRVEAQDVGAPFRNLRAQAERFEVPAP
jgi:hypothetical protein